MHRCNAIANQVCAEKENKAKRMCFQEACLIWGCVIAFGSGVGWLLAALYAKAPKELLMDSGLSFVTGPRWYMDNLWFIIWVVKFSSLLQVYVQTPDWNSYKLSLPSDVVVTLIFFVDYAITTMLYNLAEQKFRISGHGLILSMASSLLYLESDLNFRLTRTYPIRILCTSMILVHLYIMFWTALAYHTIFEALLGTALGLYSSFSVYSRFNR